MSYKFYSYDNKGYLAKVTTDNNEPYASLTYTNGDLTTVVGYDNEEFTLKYTEHVDKIGFNIFESDLSNEVVEINLVSPFYQAGYFGKKSKHLLSETIDSEGGVTKYHYQLDKEGYPYKITEIENVGHKYEKTNVYHLKYESIEK